MKNSVDQKIEELEKQIHTLKSEKLREALDNDFVSWLEDKGFVLNEILDSLDGWVSINRKSYRGEIQAVNYCIANTVNGGGFDVIIYLKNNLIDIEGLIEAEDPNDDLWTIDFNWEELNVNTAKKYIEHLFTPIKFVAKKPVRYTIKDKILDEFICDIYD